MQLALSKNAASVHKANSFYSCGGLNTPTLCVGVVYCMHFFTDVAKVRKFINPRFLKKSAVDEFI